MSNNKKYIPPIVENSKNVTEIQTTQKKESRDANSNKKINDLMRAESSPSYPTSKKLSKVQLSQKIQPPRLKSKDDKVDSTHLFSPPSSPRDKQRKTPIIKLIDKNLSLKNSQPNEIQNIKTQHQ